MTTHEKSESTEQLEQALQRARAELAAFDRSQAVIEFEPDGTIASANANFLDVVGYTLEEIAGQHHRIFVDPDDAASPAYRAFWDKLGRGEFDAGEYRRLGKGGKEVWIQASYNPVFGPDGAVDRVVKIASDVTAKKRESAANTAQLDAINPVKATIEIDLDGTIRDANENFLNVLGYAREEVVGRHHSMFVDEAYRNSQAYKDFWARLNQGEFDAGEYERFGKGGRSVWIQASYNPIFDASGRPVSVVKYATDVTDRKMAVRETVRVANSLAEGELRAQMNGRFTGEFAELQDALNSSLGTLREMVVQIREASRVISQGATEINTGNMDLSSRTQEQAAALEETAATVEELTATVKQNADNATQANQLAAGARDIAERGGSVVTEAVEAMSEINSSSRKISDIITVIDEIAFQTNLLALNAAVEAARAGEQGRGFAVVATEVRNLAQRSAGAAKEIKVLIKDSVEKVEQGSRLVDRSGHTLTDIVGGVKKVSDIVAEIAAASEEQAGGIVQVNQAVAQMDQATQQNAALVEEAAAASASMDEQSKGLGRLVSFFKTGDDEIVAAAPVAAPPVARPEPRRVPASTERKPRSSAWNQKKAPPKPAVKVAGADADAQEWEEF